MRSLYGRFIAGRRLRTSPRPTALPADFWNAALPKNLFAKLEKRQRLSAETRDEIARLFVRERSFDTGQQLLDRSGQPLQFSLIREGFAARYKILSNGRRQITAILIPGDFVELQPARSHIAEHGVIALGPCLVALSDHELPGTLFERVPSVSEVLWGETLLESAILREWLVAMGRRSALGHLAHLVCELYLRLEAIQQVQGYSFRLPLTQTDLADVLGLSMVHVNRIVKKLRSDNLVNWSGPSVTILDWARLCDVAEFDAGYLYGAIGDARVLESAALGVA
jgi:CRP-like cAMP-binding protein